MIATWKLLHLLTIKEVNKAQVAPSEAEVPIYRSVRYCLEAAARKFLSS
jgi:hypothetical protein